MRHKNDGRDPSMEKFLKFHEIHLNFSEKRFMYVQKYSKGNEDFDYFWKGKDEILGRFF